MRRVSATPFLLCSFVFLAAAAFAQEPAHTLEELGRNLKAGDEVRVVDNSGQKIQGRVAGLSSSSLLIRNKPNALPETSIREIRKRRPDPWWNGALIGAGAGAATGLIVTRLECGSNDSECAAIAAAAFIIPGTAIGAVAGALIDRSIKKFDLVFSARQATGKGSILLSPIFSKKEKRISLAFAF